MRGLGLFSLLAAGWLHSCTVNATDDNTFLTETVYPGLIRVTMAGSIGSADLGSHAEFNCKGEDKHRKCTLKTSGFMDYLVGVAAYGAINFAGAMLLIVGTAFYVFILLMVCLCTACCKKKRVHPDGLGAALSPPDKGKQKKRFMCSYGCTGFATLLMVLFIILGTSLGGQKIFAAISKVPNSVAGVSGIVFDEVSPIQESIIDISGGVVVPFIRDLNTTVTEGISLSKVYEDVLGINSTLYNITNLKVIKADINHVSSLTNKIRGKAVELRSNLAELSGEVNSSVTLGYVLKHDLLAMQAIAANMSTVIETTLPAARNLTAYEYDLFGPEGIHPTEGLVKAVDHDFDALIDSSLVNASNSYAIAIRSSYSIKLLTAGTLENDAANLAILAAKVGEYDDDSRSYSKTKEMLIYIDDIIKKVIVSHGIADQTISALRQLQEQVSRFNTTELRLHIDALLESANQISFTATEDDLNDMNDAIFGNSSITTLLNSVSEEISRMKYLSNILPYIKDIIVVQSATFNKTIYELPDKISTVYEKVENKTNDALDKVDDIVSTITDGLSGLNDFNFSSYLNDLSSARTDLDSSLNSFDRDEIFDILDNFDKNISSIDFDSYISTISDIKNASNSVNISQELLDFLDIVNATKLEMQNMSPTASALSKGYCSDDTTVYCSSNSDCTTSCIGIGDYRCSAPNQATPCAEDSDCSSGTLCLASTTRWTHLKNSLINLSIGARYAGSLSTLSNQLKFLKDEADGDPSETLDYFEDAQSLLDDMDFDQYLTDVQDIIDNANSVDFDSLNTTINDAIQSIDDIDLSDMNSTLDTVIDIVDKITSSIEDTAFILKGAIKFVYGSLASYLNSLTRSSLEVVAEDGGPGNVLRSITNTFTAIQDELLTLVRRTKKHQKGYDLTTKTKDFAEHLDMLSATNGYEQSYQNGALYYLLMLDNSTANDMIHPGDPLMYAVLTDSNDKSYPDHKYCVTVTCFTNEQTRTEEMELLPLLPVSITFPLPTTFTMVSVYLYVPISIIALMGIWVALCPLCTKKPHLRKCPATGSLVVMICLLPWLFILTGLLFPLTVLVSDVCNTGTHVATEYLNAYGDSVCPKYFGGTGTLSSCIINNRDVDIPLDIRSMFNGFLGSCDSGDDPFKAVGYAVADQLEGRMEKAISRAIEKNDKKNKVRDAVIELLNDVGTNSGEVLADFLRNSVDDSINCDHIESILNDFKAPLCTWFMGPLSWYISAVYLACWTMCCLLIPGACLVQRTNTKLALSLEIEKAIAAQRINEVPAQIDHPPIAYSEPVVVVHAVGDHSASSANNVGMEIKPIDSSEQQV